MYILNTEKLLDGIKRLTSVDEHLATLKLEDEDQANFEIFYRIMTAKKPEDIGDISFEEVFLQFSLAPDYWKYFRFDAKDRAKSIKNMLQQTPSIVRRRII